MSTIFNSTFSLDIDAFSDKESAIMANASRIATPTPMKSFLGTIVCKKYFRVSAKCRTQIRTSEKFFSRIYMKKPGYKIYRRIRKNRYNA